MKKYKLAIVGATGLVGRSVLKILEEKNLPFKKYKLFSSKKSAGSSLKFMNKKYKVYELNENSFTEKFDYAIFCAGSSISKKYAPLAVSNRLYCY